MSRVNRSATLRLRAAGRSAVAHPLTWGAVCTAHAWLTAHASCAGADAQGSSDATGYDSDNDRCPCTYHPVAIDDRASYMCTCHFWPGPICGQCWAASCECGYVFDAAEEVPEHWPSGCLCCASCSSDWHWSDLQ